jgi:hypothetical protein
MWFSNEFSIVVLQNSFFFLELRFKSNPLKDNRLKKLMEQDKIKPVLEYYAKQQTKQNVEIQDKIEILHFDQAGDLKGRQSLFFPVEKFSASN